MKGPKTTPSSEVDAPRDARRPNRLGREKSPYLLQHALNPVDWYPWGDEAFAKARAEDKPIFLSIGYSTCHWCHVMERESFESVEVATLLNQGFVPVKVDREERPDVDRLYMTAMQALGAGGGWPLNVFLTPQLEPFYGGTYFPPDARHGRPGLLQILPQVSEVWRDRKTEVAAQGARVFAAIGSLVRDDGSSDERASLFRACYEGLERIEDAERGGFGAAPKFPTIANLDFLMRTAARDPARREPALAMALRQLDAMRAGGIHDHVGGGFHRYSTDAEWLVPHFEKMLYDQAQIAWAFLDAYAITRRHEYAETARGIFAYVDRELLGPEGAFYSAEDADSEGEEGRFYVWTGAELEAALGREDAELFAYRYGVLPGGNFEHGASILHEAHSLEEAAQRAGVPVATVSARLATARVALLEVRARRVRPYRDDKVLTAWNGLMISAYARGARLLDEAAYARRAERAAEFVWEKLRTRDGGGLRRRFREGEAAGAGQLDDFAYLALGLLDLYQATFDPRWLERAAALTQDLLDRFWDEAAGGFFESPPGDAHLAIRMKDDFDGAELAGNSIAGFVLQSLGGLLDRDAWLPAAKRLFDHYAARLARNPIAMPQMLVAMDLEQSPSRHVVIVGRPDDPDTRALISEYNARLRPRDLLLVVADDATRTRLERVAPWIGPLLVRDGRATAYVCIDRACRLPATDVAAFRTRLEELETLEEQ